MRSVSSSEVICNISIRWRNCGVRTSRWERLVVNLRDIPQIRLPYLLLLLDYRGLGRTARIITDQGASRVQSLCALAKNSPSERQKTQRMHRDLNKSSHAKLFAEIQAANFRIFG